MASANIGTIRRAAPAKRSIAPAGIAAMRRPKRASDRQQLAVPAILLVVAGRGADQVEVDRLRGAARPEAGPAAHEPMAATCVQRLIRLGE